MFSGLRGGPRPEPADHSLDYGLARLKDIAFERAIEGELHPVFVGDNLIGFKRKRNDALLMFCLRHYGQDANGRRTTINYFSTRASAGAAAGGDGGEGGAAAAEASTTTVRTVITGAGGGEGDPVPLTDARAAVLDSFAGVTLDAEAQAAITAALQACAARRAEDAVLLECGGDDAADVLANDPGEHFVRIGDKQTLYRGVVEPVMELEECSEWDD